MNKKNVLKLSFSLLLLAVMVAGFTATSSAQLIKDKPVSDCPAATCPSDLSGYSNLPSCTINYGHGCVLECNVWRNDSTGAKCRNNCNWQ